MLLIDELDRTDEAFEAFLLEVLADFQVTIPEMGTVKAAHPPIVVITSNRTREIHDALKRRCLYHWIGYPDAARELAIVRNKVPGIAAKLSREIVHFVQALRKEDLFKSPGVAETLDWATALSELDVVALDPATVSDTLGVLLKYQDDIARLDGGKVKDILDDVRAQSARGGIGHEPRRTGRLAENIVYFARALRAAGIPRRPALGDRCARCAAGRRRRHARRFLLDAACGVREAARAFHAVRPGVPASSSASARISNS